jgi:hypothetical protein
LIVTLAGWVYSEYVNNTYFQSYVNGLSPILLPIVSVGFGISLATIATLLYFTMRNVRMKEGPREQDLSRKRGSAKKTIKKSQVSSSRKEQAVIGALLIGSKAMAPIAGSYSPKRGIAQDNENEEDESS